MFLVIFGCSTLLNTDKIMILLTLYKLLDYKTFIQKRSSIRTLNVMDRGPSKVFMIFKTYNLT